MSKLAVFLSLMIAMTALPVRADDDDAAAAGVAAAAFVAASVVGGVVSGR